MTELKTWKDFHCNCSKEDEYCPLIAIKDEAIKWIKQLEIDFSVNSKKELLKIRNNREYWLFTENRQLWLDFFNLTKEDLK